MEVKLFEIRDRATFIPAMAVKLDSNCSGQEDWLLSRAGYGPCNSKDRYYVYLTNLVDGTTQYDPYRWEYRLGGFSRTMTSVHRYILDHFDGLVSGQVIDVEFILGESTAPKESERKYY